MIDYPFIWAVARTPIPLFDGDKWCTDGGQTLAKLGYSLPDISAYSAYSALINGGIIEGGLPQNGAPFANLWSKIIKPTFTLRYHDRVPSYQDEDDFNRHMEAHFNENVYVWLMKWCNAYYKTISLSQENAEVEKIIHDEDGTKNGTSETSSSATMHADGTKTTADTNSPQVLADLETPQAYIDNYVKGTDKADSTASNTANSTNDVTNMLHYTHTRNLSSALGKLPIELQEMYYDKMNNLCQDIIQSYEKYFVGDMLYV